MLFFCNKKHYVYWFCVFHNKRNLFADFPIFGKNQTLQAISLNYPVDKIVDNVNNYFEFINIGNYGQL